MTFSEESKSNGSQGKSNNDSNHGHDSSSWSESSADELPGFSANRDARSAEAKGSPGQANFQQHCKKMIGRTIGPYKILQGLGQGGMGEVYMAEQVKPIRRRVALKLVKRNQDSKQILARFDAERQALAMMSHENIAKVLDVGEDNGQPYFAMELVKGIPITQYCDINKLDIDQRLGLFVQVCNAVNHAHQKGIIHRDLSPSNILVEEQDGHLTPKVIDFGLAKALNTQARLTDKTYFTEFGHVVGKVHYMSPEQAEMNPLDVDTRTDIYSLGVILYELLTGTRPLDDDTIKQNAFLRVLELIREKEAPKPSSRVSDPSSSSIEAGQRRNVSQSKLKQTLNGDLDWIVMKSLEKDRRRRYSGANEFGTDIQNYLNGDVVNARKPTLAYRLSKFAGKNKGLVLTSVTMAAVIFTALISISWQAATLKKTLLSEREAKREAKNNAELYRQQKEEAIKQTYLANTNAALARSNANEALKVRTEMFSRAKIRGVASVSRGALQLSAEKTPGSSRIAALNILSVKRVSPRRLWQGILTARFGKEKQFATGDLLTGNIRIWDWQTKKLLKSFQAHQQPLDRGGFWTTVSGLQFHPQNPNQIYSSGLDGKIARWNHQTETLLDSFQLQKKQQATALALETREQKLCVIAATNDGFLIRFDETLKEMARKKVANSRINAIAVDDNGRIGIAADNGHCYVCDSNFEIEATCDTKLPQLLCVDFSPAGDQLATGGSDGNLYVLESASLKLQQTIEAHTKSERAKDDAKKVRCLDWYREDQLYTGGTDGLIKQWNAEFDLVRSYQGHEPNVYGRMDVLDVVVLNGHCLSMGQDHTIRAWSTENGQCSHRLDGSLFPHQGSHTSDFARTAYCPSTNQLMVASESYDAYARLWNLDSLTVESKYVQFPSAKDSDLGSQTQDIAISNDGTRFVVAEPYGNLTFWETGKPKPTRSVAAHRLRMSGINPRLPLVQTVWSQDDSRLYSIGQDHQLVLWDTQEMKPIKRVDLTDAQHSIIPAAVQALPSLEKREAIDYLRARDFDTQLVQHNEKIITAGRDKFIRCWDIDREKIIWRIEVPSVITELAIAPNGQFLIIGTEKSELFQIDLTTKEINSIDTYFSAFDQLAFAREETFRVDKRVGNQQISRWNRRIFSIAISKDSQFFAVTNGHGVLSLYQVGGGLIDRAFAYDKFKQSMRQLEVFFTGDNRLLTVGADQCIREWDLYNHRLPSHGSNRIQTARLVADPAADRMIQLGQPGRQHGAIWTKQNGAWVAQPLPESLSQATDACFIPKSNKILLGFLKGKAIVYDWIKSESVLEFKGEDGAREFSRPIGVFGTGSRVAVSRKGNIAASTWSKNGVHVVEIWDVASGQFRSKIPMERGIEAMAFSPGDDELALTDQFGNCLIYSLITTGNVLEKYRGQGPQFATGLAFSPRGDRLYQSGQYFNNRILSIWDALSGGEINPTTGKAVVRKSITRNQQQDVFEADNVDNGNGQPTASYPDVAASLDGRWLATAGLDGYLVLWEVDGPKVRYKSKISTASLSSLIASATAGSRTSGPRPVNPLQITQVEFSCDSRKIYYTSTIGPICVADVAQMVQLAERTPQEVFDDVTRATGLTLDEFGQAATIEQNLLVPVVHDARE